jgi:cytochrome P450
MAMDALMAGIDTTGNQMTFLLYHLASNPVQQELLAKEVVEVVGQTGDITEAKLNKMKYLKAFQHESQRWDSVYHTPQRKSHLCIFFLGIAGLSPNYHIHVSVSNLYVYSH